MYEYDKIEYVCSIHRRSQGALGAIAPQEFKIDRARKIESNRPPLTHTCNLTLCKYYVIFLAALCQKVPQDKFLATPMAYSFPFDSEFSSGYFSFFSSQRILKTGRSL